MIPFSRSTAVTLSALVTSYNLFKTFLTFWNIKLITFIAKMRIGIYFHMRNSSNIDLCSCVLLNNMHSFWLPSQGRRKSGMPLVPSTSRCMNPSISVLPPAQWSNCTFSREAHSADTEHGDVATSWRLAREKASAIETVFQYGTAGITSPLHFDGGRVYDEIRGATVKAWVVAWYSVSSAQKQKTDRGRSFDKWARGKN